ncbi:MAG: hypothetical protein LC742_09445, partial [Acidobacteria bacterium]|nr:hypothetical protein [Acidobacteriota bacterium]
MKTDRLAGRRLSLWGSNDAPLLRVLAVARCCVCLLVFSCDAVAQTESRRGDSVRAQKLPPAEKVIEQYLKAVGGKKRIAAVRDATYEWAARAAGQSEGRATTRLKAPSSARLDVVLERGETNAGANERSAWARGADGVLRTQIDERARAARLLARLEAGRLLDYKKQNLLARTIGLESAGDEPAYVVEFRSRDNARVRFWFGASSKLLRRVEDEARGLRVSYGDYRAEGGLSEPHRVELDLGEAGGQITLALHSVRYNTGLSDALFDAPAAEALDVAALLREVTEREPLTNVKFEEYTFTAKETERELDERGDVKKETVRVWDIFLAPNGNGVAKLVSVNNAPLPAERATKEEKRVADFLQANEKSGPPTARGGGGFALRMGPYGFGLVDLLRASEFVAPRRERFLNRDAVVFDFRPRPDFRPRGKNDEILARMIGLIWIDPADKVVMRIEARLTGDFKVGGGLLMSIKPGAGFVFERMRLPDGFWVPRLF